MRERLRVIAKARWADPIAGALWRTALRDPASLAKMREAAKARWDNPEEREKMLAGLRAYNADPMVHQKRGALSKERWADPAMREKMIAGMRGKAKRRKNGDIADR